MNLFFSGIGGAGLGPLAQLSLDCGYNVTGSDVESSLITAELERKGIQFSLNQSGEYLLDSHTKKPIDLFVYSSAITDKHPELQMAKQLGIPVTKRSGLLNHIIKEKQMKLLAVAGTHGKTTTTAMLVWVFKKLNVPVSYSIGSNISFGPSAQYQKGSEWFVYECDEFDRNFLDFYPDIGIITSLDYDHPDTYPSVSEYVDAFRQFAKQSKYIIQYDSIPILGEKSQVFKKQDADKISLPGKHMRENGYLSLQACKKIHTIQEEKIINILTAFPGTQRRFEKIREQVYSDYAHHPVEIRATIQKAKELMDSLVVVYQPHQNIRQYAVYRDYKNAFEGVQKIYWLPTYLSREDPKLAILTPKELTKDIKHTEVILSEMNSTLQKQLIQDIQSGYTVMFMGAGSVDEWARKHMQ